MLAEPEENEQEPCAGVRLVNVCRTTNCGFHLTRSKWDPYPWVSAVDTGSTAETAGIRPGDCVLEVNNEDVLGRRVGEIAELVRSRSDQLSLLLWNAGVDPHCKPENLCCGPMPLNMQRLSTCLSTILSAMECPVCFDTIPPPASQCVNGHLICSKCHAKSDRCPVCRVRLSRGRSLFADQVYTSVAETFQLSKETDHHVRTAKINQIFRLRQKTTAKITQSHTNKFLEQYSEKSNSVENLSNKFLMPKTYLGEFNSDLKAKSLSTSEIFSPSSSNPRAEKEGNKLNLMSRINCGRSFESLGINVNLCKSNNTQMDHSCHCPFDNKCVQRIKENDITKHFQEVHDGPLIQYFKSKLTFNIMNSLNDTYCILHDTGKQFFLKFYIYNEENKHRIDDFHDLLIWIWILGNQTMANEFQLLLNLYTSSCPDKLLSSNCTVYSLFDVSWENVKSTQKGIFLSNSTLRALYLNKNDILLDVEIRHNQ